MSTYESAAGFPLPAHPGHPGHALAPRPLLEPDRWWPKLLGPVASLVILVAVACQLRSMDVRGLLGLVPANPVFWLCFAAYYLAAPGAEWIIFRRLWGLPASGLAALLRKLVSNELLLGYLGELYFYAWARRHASLNAAPFGSIKDVTVLSAIVGNVFCLVLLAAAWLSFGALDLGPDRSAIYLSALVILLSSFAALLFRRRLFTLPSGDLWWISGIHTARVIGTCALAALMWHLMLPSVAISCWLALAAARQIVSRLPLLPNKDVVFAGIAALLVGVDSPIAGAMTLMASLLVLAHVCVGAASLGAELVAEHAA